MHFRYNTLKSLQKISFSSLILAQVLVQTTKKIGLVKKICCFKNKKEKSVEPNFFFKSFYLFLYSEQSGFGLESLFNFSFSLSRTFLSHSIK